MQPQWRESHNTHVPPSPMVTCFCINFKATSDAQVAFNESASQCALAQVYHMQRHMHQPSASPLFPVEPSDCRERSLKPVGLHVSAPEPPGAGRVLSVAARPTLGESVCASSRVTHHPQAPLFLHTFVSSSSLGGENAPLGHGCCSHRLPAQISCEPNE